MPSRRDGRQRFTWRTVLPVTIVFLSVVVLSTRRTTAHSSSHFPFNFNSNSDSDALDRDIDSLPYDARLLHSGALSPLSYFGARRHRICMFFDWPPWTRSSVIAHTLRQCWEHRLGFEIAHYDDFSQRSEAISAMINLSSPFVAIVGQHMHLPAHELDLMKHSCDYRYYVTACRRAIERVFYHYKSELMASKYIADVDVQLNGDTEEWVKRMVTSGKASAVVNKLEHYPFDNQTLGPDYVVRSAAFSSDFLALLDGFGCRDLLPDGKLDFAQRFEEDAIEIEDIVDTSEMIKSTEETTDDIESGEETDDIVPQPSLGPPVYRDLFIPNGVNDKILADLLSKGIDSGEIVYRKLRGHGWRHNERGLQKIKELMAIRFRTPIDLPIDEEAVTEPKVAVIQKGNLTDGQ